MTVTFATKTWGGDWEQIARGGFDAKVNACQYDFDHRLLIVNNGVPGNGLDELYGLEADVRLVEEWKPAVMQHFNLTDEHFRGGEVYAIGELTAIYLCTTPYLCFVQGDCQTEGDWVTEGIKILEANPRVAVVSPASDVNTWHSPYTKRDHYMSDQAWLVRTDEFKQPKVYHYEGVDPDYPDYGGNSFEAMVGKYLKTSGRSRQILEEYWVHHGV